MSNKKKERPKRKKIDAGLFSKKWSEPEAAIHSRILKKLKSLTATRDFRGINALAQNKNLPNIFIPIYTYENIYDTYNLNKYLTPESYFHWIIGIFQARAPELKKFNHLRKEFNTSLLNGNVDEALEHINDIEDITYSWWAIENKLHTLKELKKVDTKQQIETLRLKSKNVVMTDLISALSESNSADIFISLIQEQLKEYRSSGLSDIICYGAILSSKFLPLHKDRERTLNFESLVNFQVESIIDQYLLLQSIVYEGKSKNLNLGKNNLDRVLELARIVDDQDLINTICQNNDFDPYILSTIDDYTKGNYIAVCDSINNDISPKTFGLISIYSRSRIYCNRTSNSNLYNDISDAFNRILTLQPTCNEDISYLYKVCTKFRNENWAKSLNFHLTNMLYEFNDSEGVEISRLQTMTLGKYNTPKAHFKDFEPDLRSDNISGNIPDERLIRHKLPSISDLKLDRNEFPIIADYLKAQSKLYLMNDKPLEVIDFAIDEYLRNKLSFIHLPIQKLCTIALASTIQTHEEFLSSLIILDIYGRELGGAFDEDKTETFEDFLALHNTHKPSEIFKSHATCPKSIYFLKNICTISQLDSIIYFSNNDEVVHERVSILDLLIDSSTKSQETEAETLSIEKDKVVEALFADKLRAKIETGKLYVDVQALEARRKHVYKTLFNQAKQIKGGVLLDPIDDQTVLTSADVFQLSHIDGDIPRVISSNNKTETVAKIYNQCVKDFALNEDYGLDKYLSAEIRHNVFVSQIRSCFEKLNLITEHSEDGYKSNTYWMQKYNYISPSITSKVDSTLKTFSSNIDDILVATNDKFRVSIKHEDECIFNFATLYSRVQRVSTIVNQGDDFEQFFKDLIEYMWDLSGEFAKSAQSIINDQLITRVLNEVEQLEINISNAKGDAAMVSLMAEIRTARSNFSKEVELVLNWFRFVGSNDSHSYERLGVVIEATISAFESIYGRKDLEIQFTQAKSNLLLNYRESRSLFIALFTGLENASTYRHPNTSISIEHTTEKNIDLIQIKNSIDPKYAQQNSAEFISIQKTKWTDEKLKLSRAEGGSGLFKINNFLTNSSQGFGFDIHIQSDIFTASVSLSHEYFTNRR